jgi:hypothetical protein
MTPLLTDIPREKYVARCKERALDYLDRGDLKNADLDHRQYGRPRRLQITTPFIND